MFKSIVCVLLLMSLYTNCEGFKPVSGGLEVLIWPVDFVQLTQPFAPPSNLSHMGIDLGGPRGTPIKSAHQGWVVFTGQQQGYGKMVLIEFDEQWSSLYAHLDSIFVKEGDRVHRGEVVGGMGDSGRTTGVHLHFELRKYEQPAWDPMDYLPPLQDIQI